MACRRTVLCCREDRNRRDHRIAWLRSLEQRSEGAFVDRKNFSIRLCGPRLGGWGRLVLSRGSSGTCRSRPSDARAAGALLCGEYNRGTTSVGTELVVVLLPPPTRCHPNYMTDADSQHRLHKKLFLGTTTPPVWMSSLNAQYLGATHTPLLGNPGATRICYLCSLIAQPHWSGD